MQEPGFRGRTLLRRALSAATLIYVAGFTLLQAAFRSPLNGHMTLQLLNTLGLWLYLPLALLLPLSLLAVPRRQWLLVLPLALFAAEYGPLFLPAGPVARGTPLRVMTWNVLYSNEDHRAVAAAILAERPDIVAVQELGAELAGGLAGELRPEYPYQLVEPDYGVRGMGVFSRFPLSAAEQPTRPDDPCRCQHVTLAIAGQRVDLLNVHPSIPRIRNAQVGPLEFPIGLDALSQAAAVELALQRITAAPQALLVAGDLNMTDRQPSYQRLRVRLGDAFREAGWGLGLTYPQDRTLRGLPLPTILRIDYVLHSNAFTATSAHVGVGPGSDHRYVVADLLLRG